MPKDDRTYITLHDGMPEHPKVEALSDAAFRVLVDLWCWCSRNRTDGRVPAAVWGKRAPKRIQRELLNAPSGYHPCVEPDEAGVRMHDYLEHQRSAAQIDELKQKRAEAGKRGGKAKARATASARANAKQPRSKDVAETDTEVPTTSGGDPPPESHEQRVNRLTKTYTDLVPLSKFVAIRAVVSKALKANYTEDAIGDALQRMAGDNRSVTTDSLRIELDGLPPSRYGQQRPEAPEERMLRESRERRSAS